MVTCNVCKLLQICRKYSFTKISKPLKNIHKLALFTIRNGRFLEDWVVWGGGEGDLGTKETILCTPLALPAL